MPWSQQGCTEEPDTNVSVPQQEGQADATSGDDIEDYDLDIDYELEGSDPDIEAVNEEEENSDAEYAKMELPQARTLHQRRMNCKVAERIKRVHWAQGPKIMVLWLQDMYLWLIFSSEAARLLIRAQGLESPDSHRQEC